MVSANSGAGMPGRVKAFTNLAVKWAFGMSAAFVIVLEWQAEWFVGIFLVPEAGFLQQAAGVIRIVAVSYIMAESLWKSPQGLWQGPLPPSSSPAHR